MLGEAERLVKEAPLSPRCFLLGQLLEHVNRHLVKVEILLFLLVEGHVGLVRFLPALHLVLPVCDDLEQGAIPLTSLHLLEEDVMDASEYEFLAALADFLRVHVLLQELVVVLDGVDVLAEVAEQVVQEEVERLQEVAVVLDLLNDSSV